MKLQKFLAAKSEWLIFSALLAIFFALKIFTLSTHFADGWIYFYFGKLVSEGATPYLDFYYSSPPFLPYFAGILHALLGFKLNFANFLPALFSAADGILIFIFLRKKIPVEFVLLAVFGYLFSFLNFATTDYFSEAHPLTTFALLGLLMFENKKVFLSGIFFGLAGLTKFYGLLPALFLPLLLIKKPRELTKFLGGIFVSFGIPNLIFLGIVGKEYLEMIFFSHLGKTVGISKLKIFQFLLAKDFLLLVSAAILFFAKKLKPLRVPLLAIFALALFYAIFPDVYYLYLKIFLALLVVLLTKSLGGTFRKISQKTAAGLLLVLFAANAGLAVSNYFSEQKDRARIENLSEIVAEVQKVETEIYGDFEITPLVALLAGKSIFKNYVDTNEKFLDLKIVDSSQRAEELKLAGATILTKNFVAEKIYGLESLLPEKFFAENCKIQKNFPIRNDYEDNAVIVWGCNYGNSSK